MDIIIAHATKNLCYIAAQKMTPKGIVVHSTGANNPNLKRYVDCPNEVGNNLYNNHWNNATPDGQKKCVHAFIGYDKNNIVRVAEILPLDICCWGVGQGRNGSYNYNPAYIQFEICEDGLSDKAYYQKAFVVATEYCAHLCKKFGFAVEQIVGHKEAAMKGYGSNHNDPEHWMKKFGEGMNDFRNRVYDLLGKAEESTGLKSENTVDFESTTICDGDLVAISSNATYYNGKDIPNWVKSQKWYVRGTPKGDRAVIDRNKSGTSSICSPVNVKYLTVIKNAETTLSPILDFSPYLVKVTADSLNIRKGAGTNTAKVGCITDKGVYTIIEEKHGPGATVWGKLKSGVGWISLDFVKKL